MKITPGQQLYEKQLSYIFAGDVENLIDNQYDEDATLIGFEVVVKGRAALKSYFRDYLQRLGHLEVKSTDKFQETADTVFIEAHVVSNMGPAVVYDAWVLKAGKIMYHFTGVK